MRSTGDRTHRLNRDRSWCSVDLEEAARLVAEDDSLNNEARGERLLELNSLLGDGLIGFSGLAAEWLFEDVKATWIYGYFAATVLAAHAFCIQQLAGLIRMLPDDPSLPELAQSLDDLAEVAEKRNLIELDLRARLIVLDDAARMYAVASMHEYEGQAERRVLEAERFTSEHSLLGDAHHGLLCSLAVLHRPG
jgi:hypothetical protein